jgi:carbon monoxide dehydrogenase subunit G
MQHHFTVPVPVGVAWSALLDLERVAPCMPGATLTKAEGNDFAGSVKVRLGPISLLYKGTGKFTEVSEQARRVVIDASGKDSRGNGTASATVTAVLSEQGDTTAVQVDTDLKVTGRPAQLGRGMISEVGGKLIGQFAECLSERLAGPPEAEEQPATPETAATVAESGNGESPSAATAKLPSWQVDGSAAPQAAPKASEDAIDLLGTASIPVLKRAAPIAGAVALLLIVLRLVLKRRK